MTGIEEIRHEQVVVIEQRHMVVRLKPSSLVEFSEIVAQCGENQAVINETWVDVMPGRFDSVCPGKAVKAHRNHDGLQDSTVLENTGATNAETSQPAHRKGLKLRQVLSPTSFAWPLQPLGTRDLGIVHPARLNDHVPSVAP
jgi:hypothetical protein